jgi:hypothetical protein
MTEEISNKIRFNVLGNLLLSAISFGVLQTDIGRKMSGHTSIVSSTVERQ